MGAIKLPVKAIGYIIEDAAGKLVATVDDAKVALVIASALNDSPSLIAEMDGLYNAALPFDDALGEDEPELPDNTPVTLAFGPCRDFSLTLGDLRRLRAALRTGGK